MALGRAHLRFYLGTFLSQERYLKSLHANPSNPSSQVLLLHADAWRVDSEISKPGVWKWQNYMGCAEKKDVTVGDPAFGYGMVWVKIEILRPAEWARLWVGGDAATVKPRGHGDKKWPLETTNQDMYAMDTDMIFPVIPLAVTITYGAAVVVRWLQLAQNLQESSSLPFLLDLHIEMENVYWESIAIIQNNMRNVGNPISYINNYHLGFTPPIYGDLGNGLRHWVYHISERSVYQ